MGVDAQGQSLGVMRAGVVARVARLAGVAGSGARRWSPAVLLGVLCAGAFAPLVTAGVGGAALIAAGIGAVTSVGGNVLTDVVKAGIERLGEDGGGERSLQEVEAALEQQIQQVLEAGGERADLLRGEIAGVLREVGAVGAALEAAVRSGDGDLLAGLAAGFAAVGEEFAEFGFVLADVRAELRVLRDGVDEQRGQLRLAVGLQYEQATSIRVLLEQVSAIERRTRPGERPEGGDGGVEWAGGSPYRGLLPFGESDAQMFYGRELVTAQLVSTVSQVGSGPGLLVVTGASGAGKSSLLRAGLLSAIGRGELSEPAREWPRRVIEEPAPAPLERLAMVLAPMAGLDAPTVLRSLAAEPQRAHLLVRQAVDTDAQRRGLEPSAAAACRLVLVVDQFEQIFTTPAGQGDSAAAEQARVERAAFITALHAAATIPCGPGGAPAAVVLIAVRGDFIDRCAAHPVLAAALRDGPFVVGPMSESDLRRTITGPAGAAGLDLEAGLTDTILAELRTASGGYDIGALPLVSQTMLTIWEHRQDHRLTSRGYALTGGVRHAVAGSAETAYTSLTEPAQELAGQVFHHLVGLSATGQRLTRRTATRADLYQGRTDEQRAHVDHILDAFAIRRLIVIDDTCAQLAHDVLLEAWPRLRRWLEPDLTGHALHSQLRDAAEDWARNHRAAAYLYRGERLAAVLQARARWDDHPGPHPPLTGTPAEFLAASSTAETRSSRLRRTALATLAALLAIALLTAALAVRAQHNADQQRDIAVSGQLASQSETLGDTDPFLSRLESIAAWRINPTSQARYAMLAAAARPGIATLIGHDAPVASVAFSPDGKTLAAGSEDGTARLWDVATRRQSGTSLTGTSPVNSVAFSPDGKTLAAGSKDGTARLWDMATHRQSGTSLTGHTASVNSVAFSPDGKTLATGSEDGTARLWDVTTHRQSGTPLTGTSLVYSVAFSPDGKTLATGSFDGIARLWDVATHRQSGAPLTGHTGSVYSVAFSPDGKTLATGSRDGTARLWDVTTHRQSGAPLTGTSPVAPVAFSPDGKTLATGSFDGTARLWDVATHRQSGPPLTGPVYSVAFSPDGKTVATGSADGTAQLWDVATHRQSGTPLTGHTGSVNSVAFSPDGKTLATGGDDHTARLWDVAYLADVASWLCARVGRSFTRSEWTQYVSPGVAYRKICP